MSRPEVLATDDDRQRAAADVESAAAAGILTLADADLRLREVWHARTRGDLDAVNADLPPEWLAARRRSQRATRAAIRARQELPRHVVSWLALAVLLVTIWLLTTPGGYFWPVWPILGTTPCLLGHIAAARRAPAG